MTATAIASTAAIDAPQLRRLMSRDTDVRILDVRTGGEFETSHIPGSYNVPLETLGEHARDLASVEHPVVLVCRSGQRATRAHAELAAAGKSKLQILDGGMVSWEAVGGEVVHGDTDHWALDRQVRFAAGSIALGALLASVAVPKAKWLAGGVAAGLVFSAVTDTCAMGNLLMKLPYNRTDNCDIEGVLGELNQPQAA